MIAAQLRKLYHLLWTPEIFQHSSLKHPRMVCGLFLAFATFLMLGMMMILMHLSTPWNGLLFVAFIISIPVLIAMVSIVSNDDITNTMRYLKGDEQRFWHFKKE